MIDWSKPLETIDGEPAQLVYSHKGRHLVVINPCPSDGVQTGERTSWAYADGETSALRNVPETVSRRGNAYAHGTTSERYVHWYETREGADNARCPGCHYVIREDRRGDDITITKEGA